MWHPNEKTCIRYHVAGSLATLVCGLSIMYICLDPSNSPDVYRLMINERIAVIIPYLLFIALAEAIFSIWYFLIRK